MDTEISGTSTVRHLLPVLRQPGQECGSEDSTSSATPSMCTCFANFRPGAEAQVEGGLGNAVHFAKQLDWDYEGALHPILLYTACVQHPDSLLFCLGPYLLLCLMGRCFLAFSL